MTLILFFLFLVVLLYSKRQKFLQSPGTTRVLNPFPAVQINMKELLADSPTVLSGETSQHNPLGLDYEHHHPAVFEDCRSKWHSTGHMEFLQTARTPAQLRSSMQATNITNNPLCSEYASVDITSYRTLSGPPPPSVNVAPVSPSPAASYNLGHYFPRVSSEPPSRKSYQTGGRNGDPLKVIRSPAFCEVSKEDIVARVRIIHSNLIDTRIPFCPEKAALRHTKEDDVMMAKYYV